MDAKNFFNVPQAGNPLAGKQTEFRQNQFGGSIGGPIKKNKTFFFADYEGFRKVQGQTRTLTLPTACELGKATCNGATQLGNFSDIPDQIYDPTTYNAATNSTSPFANNVIPISKIDAIGANYAALFPALPAAACKATCQYITSPNLLQFAHTADVRIDQHFSDKDMFYARYSINNTATTTQSYLPAVKVAGITVQPSGTGNSNFPGTADQRQQSIGFSHVHIFRPNLLLQLNAQLARYVSDSEGPNAGVNVNTAFGGPLNGNTSFPGTDGLLQVAFQDGGYTALGDAFALPTAYWDTNYLYGGTMSWTTGTHNVKFGVSYLKRDFSQYQIDTKGVISFSSTESDSTAGDGSGLGGNSFASLLLGFPENFDREEQPIAPQYRSYEIGSLSRIPGESSIG